MHSSAPRHAIGLVEVVDRNLDPAALLNTQTVTIFKRSDTRSEQHKPHDSHTPNGNHPDEHRSKDQNELAVSSPEDLPTIVVNRPSAPVVVNYDQCSASLRWESVDRPTAPAGQVPEEGEAVSLSYEVEFQQVEGVDPHNLSNEQHNSTCQKKEWKVAYSGATTQAQLGLLRPGRVYAVRVRCIVDCDCSKWQVVQPEPSKAVLFRTVPTIPGSPQPPALAARSRNALKLKWNPPEETGGEAITAYRLQASPAPVGCDVPAVEGFTEVFKGLERTYQVKKLQPGVRYTFRVQASNTLGEGPWSLCSAFTTQASVPSPPAAPATVDCSHDSITLNWDAPEDNGSPITGFTLERDDGAGGDFQLVYAGLALTATVKGLQSGRHYRFRLRADNDEGRSNWSSNAVATTAATPPASPSQVSLLHITRTTATLCWTAPSEDGGSHVTSYEVQLQPKTRFAATHMGPDWLTIFEGDANACAVNALAAGCAYLLRVRAANVAGYGPFCVPTCITTAADVPEPPLCLVVAVRKSHSLSLSWQPPEHDGGAKIMGYRLEIASMPCNCEGPCGPHHLLVEDAVQDFKAVYSGEAYSATVEGLTPGSLYAFRVHAVNSQGVSHWSEVVKESTRAAPPVAPQAPWAVRVEANLLALQWREPTSQGAPITGYTLEMARVPGVQPDGWTATGNGHSHSNGTAGGSSRNGGTSSSFTNGNSNGTAGSGSRNGGTSSSFTNGNSGTTAGSSGGTAAAAAANGNGVAANGKMANGSAANGNGVHHEEELVEEHSFSDSGSVADHASSTHSSVQSARLHFHTVYQGAESRAEVRGLEPASDYMFRLKAHNALGSSGWSDAVTVTTGATAPTPPTSLKATASASDAVELSWRPPLKDFGSPVTSYLVELCHSRGKAATQQAAWARVWQGTATTCVLGGLQPGRSCLVRVRAANSKGIGQPCDASVATTLAAPPSAPTKLSFSNKSATSVRVRWSEPEADNGAPVSTYVLEMARAGGEWHVCYCGPDTQTRLQSLAPASHYSVRAAAVNAAGQGAFCAPEHLLTGLLPPEPPELASAIAMLAADASGAEAPVIALTWNAPVASDTAAEAVSYEVEAVPTEEGAALASGTVRTTVGRMQECRLTGVSGSRGYSVRVRAVGADGSGHSTWSAPLSVTTPAVPEALLSRDLVDSEQEGGKAAAAVGASQQPSKRKKSKGKGAEKRNGTDAPAAAVSSKVAQLKVVGGGATAKAPPKRGWRQWITPRTQRLLSGAIGPVMLIALLVAICFMAFSSSASSAPEGVVGQQRRGGSGAPQDHWN